MLHTKYLYIDHVDLSLCDVYELVLLRFSNKCTLHVPRAVVGALTFRLLTVPIKFHRNQINFSRFFSLYSCPCPALTLSVYDSAPRFSIAASLEFCERQLCAATWVSLIIEFRRIFSPPDRHFEDQKNGPCQVHTHSEQKKLCSIERRDDTPLKLCNFSNLIARIKRNAFHPLCAYCAAAL